MVPTPFAAYFEMQQLRPVQPTSYLQDFADRKWSTPRLQEYSASTERDRGMVPTAFYSYSKVQERCLRHRTSKSNRSRDTTLKHVIFGIKVDRKKIPTDERRSRPVLRESVIKKFSKIPEKFWVPEIFSTIFKYFSQIYLQVQSTFLDFLNRFV